ncbi:MAG: radical SAM family heme chaperone HemW [Campylobacteraceae bacterium]|nr:radical SAM family heme chaperone HemW [Campylobacteraceae bacterium]
MILYLHIPFCDSKCFYCSFCSYTDKNNLKEVYLEAILRQFEREEKRFNISEKSITSFFTGGGTPSTFSPSLLSFFIKKITHYLISNAEMTIEANPNSATFEWLLGMRELGFNRISFGVQSFNDEKLKFLGRAHNQKQALEAVENAWRVGFKNISIDLIYNTKCDNKKLLLEDITIASALPINHLSAYSLTIEKNTKFYKIQNAQKESLYLAKYVINLLKDNGFLCYEISNFSRGYECFHNKGYWQHDDYIGIGCGAVGFYKNKRFYPSRNLEEYIKNPLLDKVENLSDEELLFEKIFLSLRSNTGLEFAKLPFDIAKKADILLKEKKCVMKNGRFYNTNFFLADEMALFLTS